MRSVGSIEIRRPIDEVFTYTNDHVVEWSHTVVENELLDETNGLGAHFHCVTEDRGRRMEFDGLVTLWEPPNKSAMRLTGKSFRIDAEYRFEDLQGQTRVTQECDVRAKGMIRIFFLLFGWMAKKQSCDALRKELESLKQKLESGHGQAGGGTTD